MAGKVYFGNTEKQTWIVAPQSGMTVSNQGWVSQATLLNGEASVKRSAGSHKAFEMSWLGSMNAPATEDSLHTISDFANGVYGDGPFYWLDPYAMTSNILPPHWAAPGLAQRGWPAIASGITPTFNTSNSVNNYPETYAVYDTTNDYESTEVLRIIIPTGYKLAFGWHGKAGGANTGISIKPFNRSTGTFDAAITPQRIDAGGTTRTNTNVSGTTYAYVEIGIATATASTLRFTGMIAQIIPEGDSAPSGGFISGRGSTGLEFTEVPKLEYYSSAVNNGQIGMSATLVEV